MGSMTLLCDSDAELTVEAVDADEAAVLHAEVFGRGVYDALIDGVDADARDDDPDAPPRLVVDVGANIGLFALRCATRLRERRVRAAVLAIEPVPANAAALRRNVDANGFALPRADGPHIVPLQCALGELGAPPTARFTVFARLPGESTRHPQHKRAQHRLVYGAAAAARFDSTEIECPVRALSALLARMPGVGDVHALKIDCEGDELAVLRGVSPDDWPRVRQVLVEVEDYPQPTLDAVMHLLRHTAGFDDVRVQHQATETLSEAARAGDDDLVVCVPAALRLFHVWARRRTDS